MTIAGRSYRARFAWYALYALRIPLMAMPELVDLRDHAWQGTAYERVGGARPDDVPLVISAAKQ